MAAAPGKHPDRPGAHSRGCAVATGILMTIALVIAAVAVVFVVNLSRIEWPTGEPAPPDHATSAAMAVADRLRLFPARPDELETAIRRAADENGMSVLEIRATQTLAKAVLSKVDAGTTSCFELVAYSPPDQALTDFTPLGGCPAPTT